MSLSYRSPHVEDMVERAKANVILFPTVNAYISEGTRAEARAIRSLRRASEPSRLRRGVRRITAGLVGVWLVGLAVIAGSVVVMFAGVLAGLAALSAMGSGQ